MLNLTDSLGILALIFLVAALASGLVERAPISFPMIFLGLGLLAGEHGLGLVTIDLHDPLLDVVATLSLAFVYFLDALNLRFDKSRGNWLVPALALGPGTVLTAALVAIAASLLLGLPMLQALLVGAVLSSVDPVLLRDVARDERIPHSIRESLVTEAGANDLIVLPILLTLQAIALGQGSAAGGWPLFLARLFLLGPAAGFAVGAATAWFMEWVRKRTLVSREYRALYGIGVMFAAYYAGTAVGSSGFLAVFAAGLATAVLDYDLCDCFLEYGETTSEMAMLLAFLLFGALLSSLVGTIALLPALLLALLTLALIRPATMALVLRRTSISRQARLFIGWFGPRGLSSLLFGLLLVAGGVPGADHVLAIAGVVVIISVFLHGISAAPLAGLYSRTVAQETLPEEREATAAGLYSRHADAPRIAPEELDSKLHRVAPPLVLDVRSRSTYARETDQIPGSIRVLPDEVVDWAAAHPPEREIVAYCT